MGILQYSSSKQGTVTIITIGGSLDAETAPKFDKKLKGEIAKGTKKVVCNMQSLTYIASAGLGILISNNETLNSKGGEIKLSGMSDKIQKIFKLLGFLNLFKIFKNDNEAVASFK